MSNVKELQLVCIVRESGEVYLSPQYDLHWRYYSDLGAYYIDGAKPEKTFEATWYKVSKVPEKVEIMRKADRVLLHYRLKPKFVATPQLPEIRNYEDELDEDEEDLLDTCYEPVYTEQEEKLVDVPFKIAALFESNDWKPHDSGDLSEFDLDHGLIDKITVHPAMLRTKPCVLAGKDLYAIIRKHVKENIDPKCARVTSDYDFIFTVSKHLELQTPYKHRYDSNMSLSKRAKPIWKERLITNVDAPMLSICPKAYQNADVVKAMHGESAEDLERKIQDYLECIMEAINEPVKMCTHCSGRGVEITERIKGGAL